MKAWPILVGGEFRAARSGETIDVINPATGEVLGTVPRGGREDIDDAVRAARARSRPGGTPTRSSARSACSRSPI